LGTTRNSDIIAVFHGGEIKESGVHDELVENRSWYYELMKRQLTGRDIGLPEDQNADVEERSSEPTSES
jgi:hypothetical protein